MREDTLIRAMINEEMQLCACDVTRMAEEAREIHGTLPAGSIALGRTIAAATMMCSMLKSEKDKLTLTINGGGPAGTIMAVGGADLKIKAYIANPHVNTAPSEKGGIDVAGAVGHAGILTVAKDLGLKEPYVGSVQMVSGEIGEDVAQYFLISEQQPSIVYVNTWLETDMSVINAGGIIVRPMPGCSEETLSGVEALVPEINNFALHAFAEGARGAVEKIFAPLKLNILDTQKPELVCDCSRERLKSVVVSLGREEIEDMIEKDDGAQLTCRFCNKVYDFDTRELKGLLREATEKEG